MIKKLIAGLLFCTFAFGAGETRFPKGIIGNLTGTASLATQVTSTSVSNNANYFLSFLGANSTSSQGVNVGPATYNPSTSTLTATTFVGALTGNASTSTTATNATNVVSTTQSGNTNYFLAFLAANSSSNQGVNVGPATYNPSTGLMTATGFSGSGASLTSLNASQLTSGTVPIAAATIATVALTTCTTARTVDWSTGNVFTLTLTSGDACTLTFSNAVSGQTITLWLTNGGSGGTATVVWPTAKWFPAGAPTMTTGTAALDVCTCTYNGSDYACNCLQNGG